VIEPSHGEERVSGPGSSLMIGLVATATIILTFVLGFQLGHADERTIVVTQTVAAAPSGGASGSASIGGERVQPAVVDHELEQGYYNNARVGWVVCSDAGTLVCQGVQFTVLDSGVAFHPASEHWPKLTPVELPSGTHVYLAASVPGTVWRARADVDGGASYQQLLGVTPNGSVDYFDLGALETGRYVILSQSSRPFGQPGPFSLAIGLRVGGAT
jgi:hypothetical protein